MHIECLTVVILYLVDLVLCLNIVTFTFACNLWHGLRVLLLSLTLPIYYMYSSIYNRRLWHKGFDVHMRRVLLRETSKFISSTKLQCKCGVSCTCSFWMLQYFECLLFWMQIWEIAPRTISRVKKRKPNDSCVKNSCRIVVILV